MSIIRNRRWWGDALEALRVDYAETSMTLRELAKKHRTSPGRVSILAMTHNWPTRTQQGNHALKLRMDYLQARKVRMREEIKRINTEISEIDKKLFAMKNFQGNLRDRARS